MVSALIKSLRWTIIVPLPVITELDEAERANHERLRNSPSTVGRSTLKMSLYNLLWIHSLTQSHAATEISFKALQSAHTAQAHQLTQTLSKDLTGQLAEQEA